MHVAARSALGLFIVLLAFSEPAAAAVISSCGTTISSPGTYTFERDVDCTTYAQNGVAISASGVTLDCKGYKLTGKGGFPSWGVIIAGVNNAVVKNCKLDGFFFGIGVGMRYFGDSGGSNHVITGNTVEGSNWANIYTYITSGTMISNNVVTSRAGTSGIYIAYQSFSTSAVDNTASDIAVVPSGDICGGFQAKNVVSGNNVSCGIYTEDSGMEISNNRACSGTEGMGKIFCAFSYRCGLHGSPDVTVFTGNMCDVIPTSYGGCGSSAACHQCPNLARKPITTTKNESWITVPADPELGTIAFSVMAYEARKVSERPFSQNDSSPWINITRSDAMASCEDRGPEYHLVTRLEALAISRNIERTAINNLSSEANVVMFANGSVKTNEGTLSAPASPNISSCNISRPLSDSQNAPSATCQLRTIGYAGTGGSYADENWRLRTHVLSNGEVIWDWAGNAWEWLGSVCLSDSGSGCDGCYYGPNANPLEWTDAHIGEFERTAAGPSNIYLGNANATGAYIGCTKDGNPLVRGGYNITGTAAMLYGNGIYALNMALSDSDKREYLGFRCVKNLD
ncbi:MAG: right-handed parallel beta-helix repeat-containing protein [Candidatus Micrarchaeia archaeon]|jgi:hypothetical protein